MDKKPIRKLCRLALGLLIVLGWTTTALAAGPQISPEQLEQRIHQLVNQQRRAHHLATLAFDARLETIARGHSREMAQADYFSHTDLAGRSPTQRAEAAGFSCRVRRGQLLDLGVAENLSLNYRYRTVNITTRGSHEERSYDWKTLEEVARSTLEGWLQSPGHRANLLDPDVHSEAIGVAFGKDGKIYITQMFC